MSEKIIGIDLGTSNSAAAIIQGGKPTLVPAAEGTTVAGPFAMKQIHRGQVLRFEVDLAFIPMKIDGAAPLGDVISFNARKLHLDRGPSGKSLRIDGAGSEADPGQWGEDREVEDHLHQ